MSGYQLVGKGAIPASASYSDSREDPHERAPEVLESDEVLAARLMGEDLEAGPVPATVGREQAAERDAAPPTYRPAPSPPRVRTTIDNMLDLSDGTGIWNGNAILMNEPEMASLRRLLARATIRRLREHMAAVAPRKRRKKK